MIANPKVSAVNLRYFNPVGAHPSGLIGEDPRGIPNNLMVSILHRGATLNILFSLLYPKSQLKEDLSYLFLEMIINRLMELVR